METELNQKMDKMYILPAHSILHCFIIQLGSFFLRSPLHSLADAGPHSGVVLADTHGFCIACTFACSLHLSTLFLDVTNLFYPAFIFWFLIRYRYPARGSLNSMTAGHVAAIKSDAAALSPDAGLPTIAIVTDHSYVSHLNCVSSLKCNDLDFVGFVVQTSFDRASRRYDAGHLQAGMIVSSVRFYSFLSIQSSTL
jgi:hypothetical protein